jgi:hypothetical protein
MDKAKSMSRRIMTGLGIGPPILDVPEQGVVLHDITVVNPGKERLANMRLTVKGARIQDISPSDANPNRSPIQPQYAGQYALPGLIDMHVHYPILPSKLIPSTFDLAEIFAPLFLSYGVTTVRDVGNFNKTIWKARQRMNQGEFPSPRMFCCGPILDGVGGKMGDLSKILAGPEEARQFMDELVEKKTDFIKVYDWLNPETMNALRQRAKQHGLRVVGHIPFKMRFEDAKVEDVQHLNGLQFGDPYPGFNFHDPEHFAMYYHLWANIPESRIKEIVRISKEQGIAHTPTIVTQDRIARMNDTGEDDYPSKYQMPRYVRDICWSPEFGLQYLQGHSDVVFKNLKKAVDRIKEVVRRLHEAGVWVFTGTDGPYNPYTAPGVSLHEELYHLVDCGFTAEEAWMAATCRPGEFLGMPFLGVLTKGAPADILIYKEDPTRDLSAMSTLEAVVAYGRLYTKQMLDDGLKQHRKYFEGYFFDRMMVSIARKAMENLE